MRLAMMLVGLRLLVAGGPASKLLYIPGATAPRTTTRLIAPGGRVPAAAAAGLPPHVGSNPPPPPHAPPPPLGTVRANQCPGRLASSSIPTYRRASASPKGTRCSSGGSPTICSIIRFGDSLIRI